jgi:HAE1 family hydrophobic/amphiphilic exporter-1
MLCSRFLKLSKHAREQGASHHSGGIYGRLVERPYLWSLRWSLRHRWVIMLAAALVTMSIFPIKSLHYPGLFGMVGLDFLPKDDQSEFEVAITTPAGWTLERTDSTFKEIEAEFRKWPEVVNILTTLGDTSGKISKGQGDVTQGGIYCRLIDLDDRKKDPKTGRKFSQFEIMARARQVLADYPDLRSSVQIPAAISSGTVNADVEMTLIGPDLTKLGEYADGILEQLRHNPGLADVDTTLALRKPEVRVNVNRERASDLGVSIQSIASTLQTLVGGQIVSDYKDKQLGELYDVWLRATGIDRADRRAIENLNIPTTKKLPDNSNNSTTNMASTSGDEGKLIKLTNVATLTEEKGPA